MKCACVDICEIYRDYFSLNFMCENILDFKTVALIQYDETRSNK